MGLMVVVIVISIAGVSAYLSFLPSKASPPQVTLSNDTIITSDGLGPYKTVLQSSEPIFTHSITLTFEALWFRTYIVHGRGVERIVHINFNDATWKTDDTQAGTLTDISPALSSSDYLISFNMSVWEDGNIVKITDMEIGKQYNNMSMEITTSTLGGNAIFLVSNPRGLKPYQRIYQYPTNEFKFAVFNITVNEPPSSLYCQGNTDFTRQDTNHWFLDVDTWFSCFILSPTSSVQKCYVKLSYKMLFEINE